MKKTIIIILALLIAIFYSCEMLEDAKDGLTTDEVIDGLKTALELGTDTASSVLSVTNGYYGNSFIKIPLPEEAVKVQNQINSILALAPGLSSYLNLDAKFENVVKSINHAAEDAAKEAAPIFKGAITSLTIDQGWDILNGTAPDTSQAKSAGFDSTAATQYLSLKTYGSLTNLYAPKIDTALGKDLGLGFSANDAWKTLRTSYNNSVSAIKNNFVANLALQSTGYNLDPIVTQSIGVFATEKALDGLFYKVGLEEKKIRKNPYQWAVDIIQKVFGSVFKEQ